MKCQFFYLFLFTIEKYIIVDLQVKHTKSKMLDTRWKILNVFYLKESCICDLLKILKNSLTWNLMTYWSLAVNRMEVGNRIVSVSQIW